MIEQIVPFFSSMFLHGGWMRIIGNMWILWIFGDNVEDRMGRGRFIAFYLIGGLAASFLHLLTNTNSKMPTIGASGAIAAVMGAYFRLFPRARLFRRSSWDPSSFCPRRYSLVIGSCSSSSAAP